jgi:hypothetical protein
MHRIEFVDNGILRDCTTDNQHTAVTLFNAMQKEYPQVYWYRINTILGCSGEELCLSYDATLNAQP